MPPARQFLSRLWPVLLVQLFALILLSESAQAQIFNWTPEQMIKYTSQNPYERFPDGRPKVPDSILEKVKTLCAEEVNEVLPRKGFPNQFEGDWRLLQPGKKLVGRAVTIQFMPTRADIAEVDAAEAKAKGRQRPRNQTVIDMLQPGDVIVADAFGANWSFVGNKLAYYIMKAAGTGLVVDGNIYWLDRIAEFGMPGYFRGAHPAPSMNVMVTGVNVPIRIGKTTVMPGDVVLGDREGVYFIPPQLVQEVVEAAQNTQARDEWTMKMFDTGKYKSSEIYGRPSDPALAKEREEYIKRRVGRK